MSREILYDAYVEHPSHASAERDGGFDAVYRHHLRGWLPDDLDAPILDLGCGDGYLLGFLSRQGHRSLMGIDRSPGQVERSRDRVPEAEIVHGDALELLGEREARFGAIVCIDVLEHLSRDELVETLPRLTRALLPGGSLIARVPNAESPFCDSIRYGDLTHEIAFTAGALSHLFRLSGLSAGEFRECDPVAKSAAGALRSVAWKLLRQLVRAWNLVETGSSGSGVYTRVMLARAWREES